MTADHAGFAGVPRPGVDAALGDAELKACCADAYANPAVRWVLGGDLHPGGAATTRRALTLAGLGPGGRLLDVASGSGASALLAAAQLDAEVVGIEYGEEAVRGASAAATAAGLSDRVEFRRGDAEALPVADASRDVVLCECSLCTFPNKDRAAAELRRVLAPGGRLALCDVVVEGGPLPPALRGAMATIACVGGALPAGGYRALLERAGLLVERTESAAEEIDRFVGGIEDRLRGARLLGIAPPAGTPLGVEAAIEATRQAREAIAAGQLGYAIVIARRPSSRRQPYGA